jgi:hypothetical protein
MPDEKVNLKTRLTRHSGQEGCAHHVNRPLFITVCILQYYSVLTSIYNNNVFTILELHKYSTSYTLHAFNYYQYGICRPCITRLEDGRTSFMLNTTERWKVFHMIWHSRMSSSYVHASENFGIFPTQKLFYD